MTFKGRCVAYHDKHICYRSRVIIRRQSTSDMDPPWISKFIFVFLGLNLWVVCEVNIFNSDIFKVEFLLCALKRGLLL